MEGFIFYCLGDLYFLLSVGDLYFVACDRIYNCLHVKNILGFAHQKFTSPQIVLPEICVPSKYISSGNIMNDS